MNKEELLQKTCVVALLALVCTFLWGSAFPCIKIGYGLYQIDAGATFSQILFAGLRFTLAGLLTILIGSLTGRTFLVPRAKSIPRVMKLSAFQTIMQYMFFYVGLAHTSGVKASIIEGSNTFVAICVAALIFRNEAMTLRKIAGCLVGFAGVLLVNVKGGGMDLGMTLNGEGFIFISVLAYGISSSLLKEYSKEDNPVMMSGYQFLFGGLVMALVGFVMGGRIDLHVITGKAVLMLLYLAFISAVAYTLWGILVKYNPISKVSVFGFANPVFGVILSAWWLNEKDQALGWKAALALLLVSIGIWIVNKPQKKVAAE